MVDCFIREQKNFFPFFIVFEIVCWYAAFRKHSIYTGSVTKTSTPAVLEWTNRDTFRVPYIWNGMPGIIWLVVILTNRKPSLRLVANSKFAGLSAKSFYWSENSTHRSMHLTFFLGQGWKSCLERAKASRMEWSLFLLVFGLLSASV